MAMYGSVVGKAKTRRENGPKAITYRSPLTEASVLPILITSVDIISIMISSQQAVPKDTLFRDGLFKKTCRRVEDRNEARVTRDITLLIVTSAEVFAIYGTSELDCLIESTNEGWDCLPLTGTCPQPHYSVGFRRGAFMKDQLGKLSPFIDASAHPS